MGFILAVNLNTFSNKSKTGKRYNGGTLGLGEDQIIRGAIRSDQCFVSHFIILVCFSSSFDISDKCLGVLIIKESSLK